MKKYMRQMIPFPLILALVAAISLLITPPCEAAPAEDPAGAFLRGYTEFQNGERLEAAGDVTQAAAKFRFAATILEQIARQNPEWQPLVVQYRLRKITDSLNRVENQTPSRPALPVNGNTNDRFLEGDLPRPDPPARSSNSINRVPPSQSSSLPDRTQQSSENANRSSDGEISKMRQENRELREQLSQRTAELKSALHAVDKTRVSVVELRHELAQTKSRLDDALKDRGSVEKLRADFAKQLAVITGEFEKTRAERTVLEEENERLHAKLEQAATYITASDAIRKTLESERKTFHDERESARADRNKVQAELQTALAEVKDSRERLSELAILTAENKKLQEKAATSEKKATALQAKIKENDAAIAKLQTQLTKTITPASLDKVREELGKEIAIREEMSRLAEQEKNTLKQKVEGMEKREADLTESLRVAQNSSGDLGTLQKDLQTAQAAITKANEEKAVLEKQLAEAKASQGNTPPEITEKLAATTQRIADLEASKIESEALAKKLADAETKLAGLTASSPDKDGLIATLQTEVSSVSERLFAMRGELTARDTRIDTLEKQLDNTAAELTEIRLRPGSPDEPGNKEALVENELLRNILLRELKEQSRRQQAKRLIEEEIKTLAVQSETISENLQLLGAGIALTDEERKLFRMPVALMEESDAGNLEVSIAFTKPSGNETASSSTPPKAQGFEHLTPALKERAQKAQHLFEQGNLAEAEKQFFALTKDSPNNYYIIAQLAATQFQAGKTNASEIALNRVMELHPEDPFALSILGVVYFRQGKLPEAEATLRKAIELDPKKARSYNYLGIVLSQLAKSKEAETVLQKSINIDPKYAEAHFNLAVVYATQQPPALELARKHYQSAIKLGADADPSLERIIR